MPNLDVRHLDLPLSPAAVSRAVLAARAGELPDPWSEPPAAFDTIPVSDAGDDEEQANI